MLGGCGRRGEGIHVSWLPELTCFCKLMQILAELDLCALPGSLELNQHMADKFTAKVRFCCAAASYPSGRTCDSHSGARAPRVVLYGPT